MHRNEKGQHPKGAKRLSPSPNPGVTPYRAKRTTVKPKAPPSENLTPSVSAGKNTASASPRVFAFALQESELNPKPMESITPRWRHQAPGIGAHQFHPKKPVDAPSFPASLSFPTRAPTWGISPPFDPSISPSCALPYFSLSFRGTPYNSPYCVLSPKVFAVFFPLWGEKSPFALHSTRLNFKTFEFLTNAKMLFTNCANCLCFLGLIKQ